MPKIQIRRVTVEIFSATEEEIEFLNDPEEVKEFYYHRTIGIPHSEDFKFIAIEQKEGR